MGSLTREHALQEENRRLRVALDFAQEQVRQLRVTLTGCGGDVILFKRVFGLTPQAAAILTALMEREQCSHEALALALPQGWAQSDERDVDSLAKVNVHKLRRKLLPLAIQIETIWGWGYRISSAEKAKVWRAVEASRDGLL